MFEFSYLRYYMAVYETKSMSEAARRLFISRQAISRFMIACEKELGVRLYTATPAGLIFTQEGECLYRYAKKMVAEADAFAKDMKKLRDKRARSFSVACGIQEQGILRPVIGEYGRMHPKLDLQLDTGNVITMYSGLTDGVYDLILTGENMPDETKISELFCRRPVRVLMRADDAPEGDTADLAQLAGRCLLLDGDDPRYLKRMQEFITRHALPVSCEAVPHAELAGIAGRIEENGDVLVLGGEEIPDFGPDARTAPRRLTSEFGDLPDRSLFAVWRKKDERNPAVLGLLRELRDADYPESEL